MLNLLSAVRLNIAYINEALNDLSFNFEEYRHVQDKQEYYGAQLHYYGYRFNFAHNMLFIACAAVLLGFIWLFIHLISYIRPRSTNLTAKDLANNILARFALEAHFETMICAFITLSSIDAVGTTWWFLSLAFMSINAIVIFNLSKKPCNLESN